MIDLRPLLDTSFWFNLEPSLLSPSFEKAFFLAFGVMVVLGAIIRIVSRQKKHDRYISAAFGKVGGMLLAMGLTGMLWFFFTFELLYILGARFWFLVWLIGLIVWIVSIIRYVKITVPRIKSDQLKRSDMNQYLPRKKKK